VTPPSQNRSMVESALTESLDIYINESRHINERQLAQLAKDLIDIAGDDPRVVSYINLKAAQAIGEEGPWT